MIGCDTVCNARFGFGVRFGVQNVSSSITYSLLVPPPNECQLIPFFGFLKFSGLVSEIAVFPEFWVLRELWAGQLLVSFWCQLQFGLQRTENSLFTVNCNQRTAHQSYRLGTLVSW